MGKIVTRVDLPVNGEIDFELDGGGSCSIRFKIEGLSKLNELAKYYNIKINDLYVFEYVDETHTKRWAAMGYTLTGELKADLKNDLIMNFLYAVANTQNYYDPATGTSPFETVILSGADNIKYV